VVHFSLPDSGAVLNAARQHELQSSDKMQYRNRPRPEDVASPWEFGDGRWLNDDAFHDDSSVRGMA
jgi:hypothetical protein